MAGQGNNEGFRILDEFVCTAILGTTMPPSGSAGRGINDGISVTGKLDFASPYRRPVDQTRIAALRAMSNAELLALIRASGADMSGQELLTIHDIAAERLSTGSQAAEAIEVSREAMRTAVKRS